MSDDQQEIERLRDRTHELANALHATVADVRVATTKLDGFGAQLTRIEQAVTTSQEIVQALEPRVKNLETRLRPIEQLVFGAAALMLVAVVAAILAAIGLPGKVHP